MGASSIFGRENLGSSRRPGLINFSALAAVVFCSPTVEGQFVYFTDCGSCVLSYFPVAIMQRELPPVDWNCEFGNFIFLLSSSYVNPTDAANLRFTFHRR